MFFCSVSLSRTAKVDKLTYIENTNLVLEPQAQLKAYLPLIRVLFGRYDGLGIHQLLFVIPNVIAICFIVSLVVFYYCSHEKECYEF